LELHRYQDELENSFLENKRILKDDQVKDEKLVWLRGQRLVMLRMLRLQACLLHRFMALDGRIAQPSLRRQVTPLWQRRQQS
jgi:hypothetical protein